MRLTPLDIRKQEFKKGMRGLDSDEVYAFLATVADEYEAALNDNKALRERLLELDDKVQEYRNMEKTLRDTLLTAERITVDAKDNARREAELIIKQAELDADKGVRDIKTSATQLRQEIKSLKSQRESYLARMKMLVESHLKLIETAERDMDEEDQWFAVDTSKTAPSKAEDKTEASTASAKPLPAATDIKTKSPAPQVVAKDPEEPTTKSMTTEESPLPATAPDNRKDVRAEAPPVGEMAAERSAADRLNDLLDRVVQQTTISAAETDVATQTETATETATQDLETVAGETSHETEPAIDTAFGGEVAEGEVAGSEEWSLDQLKSDILHRRHGKDETSG